MTRTAHDQAIRRREGVEKWDGSFEVRTDSNRDGRAGGRIVVCGRSGSGKSTLIRCINRLETGQKGRNVAAPQPRDKNSGAFELWRKPDFCHGNGYIGQVRVTEGGARKQPSQHAPHSFAYPQLPPRWARRVKPGKIAFRPRTAARRAG